MASRSKKAHLVLETPDNTESSSSSESDNSEAEEEEDMTSTDELQVRPSFKCLFCWTFFFESQLLKRSQIIVILRIWVCASFIKSL